MDLGWGSFRQPKFILEDISVLLQQMLQAFRRSNLVQPLPVKPDLLKPIMSQKAGPCASHNYPFKLSCLALVVHTDCCSPFDLQWLSCVGGKPLPCWIQ